MDYRVEYEVALSLVERELADSFRTECPQGGLLDAMRYSLLAAGVKIIATVALIRLLGIQGAALGSLAAFLFYFLLVVRGLRNSVRLRPDWKSTARILASALLCALAAWLLCRILPFGDTGTGAFLKTVYGALAGGGVYLLCLLLSGELKPELEMVRQAIQARRGFGGQPQK